MFVKELEEVVFEVLFGRYSLMFSLYGFQYFVDSQLDQFVFDFFILFSYFEVVYYIDVSVSFLLFLMFIEFF